MAISLNLIIFLYQHPLLVFFCCWRQKNTWCTLLACHEAVVMLPTRYKPPTRCKLSLTRCKLLARTYKVHLVSDNLHLVACPRNHESLISGPKAPIHRTHQLCQNANRDWQNAYCHYKMQIVIDNMYLGTDKVQLAPMRVTIKCT